MYASATTSAIVHMLVVTVGLLGWPVLNVTFNEIFGKAPQRDVLSYGEQSDFEAKYQPGALTDNSGEDEEAVTTGGIDTNDDLDTMSDGDLGFDEPGDGPQDATKSGEPDALVNKQKFAGDEGTGKDEGEESPSDGTAEEEGGQGEDQTAGSATRELVIFVTLRPEPLPDAEPVEAEAANEKGPADAPAPKAVDSTGETPGELAALMQGEPTPERGVPQKGQETGELEGESPDARKAEPTAAAGPEIGEISPPDAPELAQSETEGTASPDAPLEDQQALANPATASARLQTDQPMGAQEDAERPGEITDNPADTDATTPQSQLAETEPNKRIEGFDTRAALREDHRAPATDESGAQLPQIGGKLSGAQQEPVADTGPQNETVQEEIQVAEGGQLAALTPADQFSAPNAAEKDQAAPLFDPNDPLAKIFAKVAGEDADLARALQETREGETVGGTPDPGALKTNMLLEQAAEAGLARAQLELAKRYIIGEVDGRDPEKLVELLRNAAEQGSEEAQLLLGALFADGKVVSRDMIQSRVFFELAAAQGSEEAKEVIPVVERQMAPEEIVDSRRLAREYRRFLQAMPRPAARGNLGQGLRDQLLDAAAAGNTAKIAELLARGADLDGTDTSGRTAVINAAWRGRQDVVDLLVELGADFNVTDYDGRTALSWAASNGHTEIVDKLLGAGAETGIADNEGLTPLMRAAWNGHEIIVRTLIDRGARVSESDPKGNTALDYAIQGGHREIARVLRAFGA